MNFLGGYGSSDDEADKPSVPFVSREVISAPIVVFQGNKDLPKGSTNQNNQMIMHNPKAEAFLAPAVGPKHPFKSGTYGTGKRAGMGYVEEASVDASSFDEQFQCYLRNGYAVDMNTGGVVGDQSAVSKRNLEELKQQEKLHEPKRKKGVPIAKRVPTTGVFSSSNPDAAEEDGGPWAAIPVVKEEVVVTKKHKVVEEEAQVDEEAEEANRDPTMHILEPDEEDEKWEKVCLVVI